MELLPKALLISAIGMGLVFAAIFVLWGLMALLVKLTTDAQKETGDKQNRAGVAVIEVPRQSVKPDPIKVHAVAAAVAAALALAAGSARRLQPKADPATSPWKDTHRAMEINRRSGCFNR